MTLSGGGTDGRGGAEGLTVGRFVARAIVRELTAERDVALRERTALGYKP